MTFDDRERCETCHAFDAKDQECRRHAPTAVMVPGVSALSQQPTMNVLGLWPSTRPDLWCLDYRAKENA